MSEEKVGATEIAAIRKFAGQTAIVVLVPRNHRGCEMLRYAAIGARSRSALAAIVRGMRGRSPHNGPGELDRMHRRLLAARPAETLIVNRRPRRVGFVSLGGMSLDVGPRDSSSKERCELVVGSHRDLAGRI